MVVTDDKDRPLRVPDICKRFLCDGYFKLGTDGGRGKLDAEEEVGAEGGHVDSGDAGGVGFTGWGEAETHCFGGAAIFVMTERRMAR